MSGSSGKTVTVDKARYEESMAQAKKAESEKDYPNALWYYLAASDADPSNPDAHLALARIHSAMKHPDSALKSYGRALDLGAKRDPGLEKLLESVQPGKLK